MPAASASTCRWARVAASTARCFSTSRPVGVVATYRGISHGRDERRRWSARGGVGALGGQVVQVITVAVLLVVPSPVGGRCRSSRSQAAGGAVALAAGATWRGRSMVAMARAGPASCAKRSSRGGVARHRARFGAGGRGARSHVRRRAGRRSDRAVLGVPLACSCMGARGAAQRRRLGAAGGRDGLVRSRPPAWARPRGRDRRCLWRDGVRRKLAGRRRARGGLASPGAVEAVSRPATPGRVRRPPAPRWSPGCPERPYTMLSCGVRSTDTWATDAAPGAVQRGGLRPGRRGAGSCERLVVGAGTVRTDNPRLVVRSQVYREERRPGLAPSPMKITVTHRADRVRSNFFTIEEAEKIAYQGSAHGTCSGRWQRSSTAACTCGCARTRRRRKWPMVEGGGVVHPVPGRRPSTQSCNSLSRRSSATRAPRASCSTGVSRQRIEEATLAEVRQIGDVVLLRYVLGTGTNDPRHGEPDGSRDRADAHAPSDVLAGGRARVKG